MLILITILLSVFSSSFSQSIDLSRCRDKDYFCFGQKDGVGSWNRDHGCLKFTQDNDLGSDNDLGCNVYVFADATNPEDVKWTMRSKWNDNLFHSRMHLSITGKDNIIFNKDRGYVLVGSSRFPRNSIPHSKFKYFKNGRLFGIDCKYNYAVCFKVQSQIFDSKKTEVIFTSPSWLHYDRGAGIYDPSIFLNGSNYVHIYFDSRISKDGKTKVERLSSKRSFFIFKKKNHLNNPGFDVPPPQPGDDDGDLGGGNSGDGVPDNGGSGKPIVGGPGNTNVGNPGDVLDDEEPPVTPKDNEVKNSSSKITNHLILNLVILIVLMSY